MHAFLLYIHTFYLINYIYIYIHTQQQQQQKEKKKSLVFSIKIIFDGDLS